jgi:putative addiction module component (TIGR02574 family)
MSGLPPLRRRARHSRSMELARLALVLQAACLISCVSGVEQFAPMDVPYQERDLSLLDHREQHMFHSPTGEISFVTTSKSDAGACLRVSGASRAVGEYCLSAEHSPRFEIEEIGADPILLADPLDDLDDDPGEIPFPWLNRQPKLDWPVTSGRPYTRFMPQHIDIEALTPDEKIELIDRLWESLGRGLESDGLTPEQRAELDRRVDHDTDPGEPWSEVRRRIEDDLR